ncbi:extracellular solute-binding protein [Paenibacillus filicis]|uniref:Extracellular solute-binding protein n=1 Tax=Paenibacillus filicis TaxID=669464 RepID=A0ABU9DN78_9BACL
MKKTLHTVIAGTLMVSMLSACGSGGNKSEGGTGAGAGAGGTVKIEFFQNKLEAKDSFNKLITKFNEANPSIQVTQVNPPDAETVLKTRLAKKDLPDVIGLGANDTYISLSQSGVFDNFTNDALLSNVQPAYIDMLNKQTGSAELNGVPFSANASGVLYNKAMFKELGIDIPKTWNELIAAADKIKAAGKTPFYLTVKDAWTSLVLFNSLEPGIVGLDFFKDRKDGKVAFKDSFREVAEKQLKILDYGQKDAFGKGYNDGNVAFAKGEAAMYIQGVWAIPEIKKANPSMELGIFPFPSTNDAAKNKLVSGVDTLLTISKSTKHKEEAKKFIAFLLQPENSKAYIDEQKAFSTIKGVVQSDASVADLNSAFESGSLVDFADHYIPGAMNLSAIIQDFLQKKDIDQYLSTLDKEWDKVASRK